MTRQEDAPLPPQATRHVEVTRFREGAMSRNGDLVTVEEPLEIRVSAESAGRRASQTVAVTMRTPGEDLDLAAGFLHSEGVVTSGSDIWRIEHCREIGQDEGDNVVEVQLAPGVELDVGRLSRNVLTTSACGICGRTSIESVYRGMQNLPPTEIRFSARALTRLSGVLTSGQPVFARTGGLHAAALFGADGKLEVLREDVGRHNALDKVVGGLLLADELPASDRVVLVSGRSSFELVQKALMAGIPILAAVGAPSSLAVELAQEFDMSLIGFLGPKRFNVYSGEHRIDFD